MSAISMFGLIHNGLKALPLSDVVLLTPSLMTALTRARAQEKFFIFSPLSITFLDILHYSTDSKRHK